MRLVNSLHKAEKWKEKPLNQPAANSVWSDRPGSGVARSGTTK